MDSYWLNCLLICYCTYSFDLADATRLNYGHVTFHKVVD